MSWCIFFFSSRRRHTRFKCDWSSDVCSSDLYRHSSSLRDMFRENLAHFRKAFGRRVVRVTLIQCLLRRVLDELRSVQVGLPDLHVNHVDSLGLESLRLCKYLECRLLTEKRHRIRDLHGFPPCRSDSNTCMAALSSPAC